MKKLIRLAALAIVLVQFSTYSQAQLILNVAPSTQTFWFTGSTEGNGYHAESIGMFLVGWSEKSDSGDGVVEEISIDSMVSSSNGAFYYTAFGYDTTEEFESIILGFYWSDAQGQFNTITGLGEAQAASYSSFSTEAIAALEGLTSLPLHPSIAVSGFDNLSVVTGISAVPEPSTYAMIAGIAMLGFVVWRRRVVSSK